LKIRRIVSVNMFLSFVVMSLTGLVLWIVPQGRVAHWADWRLLGLDKDQWGALHTTFMVLFLVGGIWHLVLNWRALTLYLKDRARRLRVFTGEFNVALVLCVFFAAGTLAAWPPLTWVTDLGAWAQTSWERTLGSPPWGHAELTPLGRFVGGLENWARWEGRTLRTSDPEAAAAILREAGYHEATPDRTVLEIAHAAGRSPQQLLEALLEPAATSAAAPTEAFPHPASGLGRLTLTQYAERSTLDVATLQELGARRGWSLDPDTRFKDLAEGLGLNPGALLDSLEATWQRP
jgi:hypothetical protein